MKKIITIILFLSVGCLFAQAPIKYSLRKGASTDKVNDSTPKSNSILDIVVANETIWLGTSKGLSKSVDNGENWYNYYGSESFGSQGIIAVANDNGVIWTSTGGSETNDGNSVPIGTGFRYSIDNGETWTKLEQPVDDPGDSIVIYGENRIRALPVTVRQNNITYDIAFTKNTVWIASFAGGLRKSNDNGETWKRVVLPPDNLDSISPEDTLKFSLQPVAGKFGTENYLNHRVFSVIGIDDSTIYVGTAGGINKSTDNGKSWVKFTRKNQEKPISGNFVTALGYDKIKDVIWASTWKADDPSEQYGVSASADSGKTWETFLIGERAHNFGFKYFDNSESHVMVPTDNGVFRSFDDGKTWIVAPVIRDAEYDVSIKTPIFYSVGAKRVADNTTDVWLGSNKGLAKLTETDNEIWDGTWKVYYAAEKSSGSYAFPNPFSPNNEEISILYPTTRGSSEVTIRIFDFGMNLVRTLIQNVQKIGIRNQTEEWDGRDDNGNLVANGVYFYRVDLDYGDPMFGKIMVLK